MSSRIWALGLAWLALLLAVWACQMPFGAGTFEPEAVETALEGTLSARSTQTAASVALPTETPEASTTPTPSLTPTITPTPQPFAELSRDTNCRTGPLRVYDLITTVLRGERVDIVGKNAQGTYWFVVAPDSPDRGCWMWGRYAQVSGDTGFVPVFTPPPTPTPAYDWSGMWTVWVNEDHRQGSMTLEQSGGSISGTLTGEGDTFSISGATSDGGRRVVGEILSEDSDEIPFRWQMLDNREQFVGSYTLLATGTPDPPLPYCGARAGQPMPEPCQWP